ncbi:hypothetical protein [Pedobacter sp.]|jgi:hypothetical protein|uniref:hypothetical protein n=1 Tax=Pedobacter sp. TaxID=1411316 RepID=UPI002C48E408|nr:hypothetical protein [Pedobacter sp.]HWW38754.1 hypothetical protein [Pedobacter sp.]
MKLKILLHLLLVSMVMLSCKKETVIQPDTLLPEYTLPQGNHDYDTRIVNFKNKYGCYILYKFTDKDFQWNITNLIPYVADQGDENYITPALNALDTYLFHYYSDSFLKLALPYKIILSARIRKVDPSSKDTLETPLSSVSSFSHFAFGHASSRLATLSADELKQMKADLHTEFWNQAVGTGKVEIPPIFAKSTDYMQVGSWNEKNYGVLGESTTGYTVYSDFAGYIQLIASNTASQLEQTLFLPENDPNGKYRLKYNAIVNYYKATYGIDLQAIGADQ